MRQVARESRRELWFWRVGAVAACALLVVQVTRARSNTREVTPADEVAEQATSERTSRRDSTRATGAGSARLRLLLANLERAHSTSGRCAVIDRAARLPEVDEAAVALIARYSEAEFPLELRRCATYSLGNIAHEAAFAPLHALAQGDVPVLVETALIALASRPDRASQKAAIELSEHAARYVRVSVAVSLAESGALEATPLLAKLLEDGGSRDRDRLLMALGRSGDPRAVGVLQGYLSRGNRMSQFNAIYALGEIGGSAATETLLHVLRERPELAAQAASALARTGSDEAREALLELAEKNSGYGAGLSALQALAELDGPGVRELMESSLAGGPSNAQITAIEYFASRQDGSAFPQLEQLARAGNMQTSSQALSALSRMGSEQALDVLEEVAKGNGPNAPMALQMLNGDQADPERARRLALAQIERGNYGSLEVLMNDESPEARAALSKLALNGEPSVGSRAMWALAQRNDPETRKLTESLAASSDPQKRSSAMWALAQSGDPTVVKTLRGALGDSDDNVRREAVQALSQFGGEEAEAALFTASRDKSPEVVGAAANSLAQLGTPAALDRIEQIARVPATAQQGLMALLGNAPARALPVAQQLITSADPDARRAALMAVPSLPGDDGAKIMVSALHHSDPEFVREALETVANNYLTEDMRSAVRELSSSQLPADLKERAAQIADGNGQVVGVMMHPGRHHGPMIY
ncbi:MAG: HEAT repeat domain-containing protein [Polyangiales bacterium]